MHTHEKIDRGQFLLVGAAGALATLATPATASQGPPLTPQGDDWGFLQWGATAELVAIAFWDRALREPGLGERTRGVLRAARSADAAHLRHFSATLGEEVPTEDDFKVLLPKRALKSRAGILALGEEMKEIAVRVYLGGVMDALDPATRLLLGQLVVNDTQHIDSLRALSGKPGPSARLHDPLGLEPAGLWLDRFLRVRSS